jgi:putative chitinase
MGADILARLFGRPHPVATPVATPEPPPVALAAVLKAAGFVEAEFWARHLAEPCQRFGIHPGRRLAAFAATVAHESANGQVLNENLNYSAAGLMKTWPNRFGGGLAERYGRTTGKPADQEGIANVAYGGRMGNGPPATGDGWAYRGRGLIQLTGRDAYRRAGAALGLPLEVTPAMAAEPQHAAAIAAWTWGAWKGCNPLADREDIEAWRRAINGGLNGLDDVRRRYRAALAA